jgi:hypothetical protein
VRLKTWFDKSWRHIAKKKKKSNSLVETWMWSVASAHKSMFAMGSYTMAVC